MSSKKAPKPIPIRKPRGTPNRFQFGVSCKGYPANMLTPEQGSLVESALRKKFSKGKHKQQGNFQSFTYDSSKGYVLVKCSRIKARVMVQSTLPQIIPWPGACLRLVKDKRVIKTSRDIYSCRFPDSCTYTWTQIYKILRQQNEGLNREHWKCVKQWKIDSESIFVAYFIPDAESVATVEKLGGMLNYRSFKVRLVKCDSEQGCEPLNDDGSGLDDEEEEDDEDLSEDHEDDFMPESNRETSTNQDGFPGNSSGNSCIPNRSNSNWNQNDNSSGNWNDAFSNNTPSNPSGNYGTEECFREGSFNQNFSDNSSGNISRQLNRNTNWNRNGNSYGGSNQFPGNDFNSSNSGNAGNSFGGNGNFSNERNSFNRANCSTGGGNWSNRPSTSYGNPGNSFNMNRSSGNWNNNGNFSQQPGRNTQNHFGGNWNGNGNSWDESNRFADNDFGRGNSGGGNGNFSNAGNSFNNLTGGSGNWSNHPGTSYGNPVNTASRKWNQFYGNGNNRGNRFF